MSSRSTRDGSNTKDEIHAGHETLYPDAENEPEGMEIELRPFRYMVGGHSYVLEVSRSVICKNYRHEEATFYKSLPEELRFFTPKYLGEIYVKLHEVDDQRKFTANIPASVARKCRLLEREHDNNNEQTDNTALPDTTISKCSTKDNEDNRCQMSAHLEEWSSRCLHRYNKAAGTWENKQTKKFFMLENLMHDYDRPSIIDIKLGKYPKADGTVPDENSFGEVDQIIKFRIDGYKKFDASTGTYTVVHKDISRNYSMKKVIEEIGNFFHDGRTLRADVINTIIERLEALQLILSSGKEWTFNAASLLFMYDNENVHDTVRSMCINGSIHGNSKCDTSMKAISVEYDTFSRANSDNCEKSVQFRNKGSRKLNAPYTVPHLSQKITSGYASTSTEGSYETLNTDLDSNNHYPVKADVKLIDFLKTAVCKQLVDENDNNVKGVAFEILKLKEILLQMLCSDNV